MKLDIRFRDIQTGRYELNTKTFEVVDKLTSLQILGDSRLRLFCNDGTVKMFSKKVVINGTMFDYNKAALKVKGFVEITFPGGVVKNQFINENGTVLYFDKHKNLYKRHTEIINSKEFIRLVGEAGMIRIKLETLVNAHFMVNKLLKQGYKYVNHEKVLDNSYLVNSELKIYSLFSHKFLAPSVGDYIYSLHNKNGNRSNISAKLLLHKMDSIEFKTPWRTGKRNHSTKYDESYVKMLCEKIQAFKGCTSDVMQSLGIAACDDDKQLYNLIYRIKTRKAWKYISEKYSW